MVECLGLRDKPTGRSGVSHGYLTSARGRRRHSPWDASDSCAVCSTRTTARLPSRRQGCLSHANAGARVGCGPSVAGEASDRHPDPWRRGRMAPLCSLSLHRQTGARPFRAPPMDYRTARAIARAGQSWMPMPGELPTPTDTGDSWCASNAPGRRHRHSTSTRGSTAAQREQD